MTDLECEDLFRRLIAMLQAAGVHWLVDQVMVEVQTGKLGLKEVSTLKVATGKPQGDLFTGEPSYRSGRKAEFPVSVAYNPREQLELILVAIERVIIDTHDMEDAVFQYLGERSSKTSEVVFFSEDMVGAGSEATAELSFSRASVAERREAVKELRSLLSDLRKEMS